MVAVPANTHARIGSKAELVDLLIVKGMSRAAASKVAAGGFDALSKNTTIDREAAARLASQIDQATRNIESLK